MMTLSNGIGFRVTGPLWGEQSASNAGFDVFFDFSLNKRLNEQTSRRWFETPGCSLWRHRNVNARRILIYSHSLYLCKYWPCDHLINSTCLESVDESLQLLSTFVTHSYCFLNCDVSYHNSGIGSVTSWFKQDSTNRFQVASWLDCAYIIHGDIVTSATRRLVWANNIRGFTNIIHECFSVFRQRVFKNLELLPGFRVAFIGARAQKRHCKTNKDHYIQH